MIRACKCGCGQTFECKDWQPKVYFNKSHVLKGIPKTEEQKRIIGLGNKGKGSRNRKGYVATQESYQKRTQTKKRNGTLGHTEATKKRMRESALLRVYTKPNPCTNTKPEREMQVILKTLGFAFKHSFLIKDIKHRYLADFFLSSLNLIIETDGKYWHNYPEGNPIDHTRTSELREAGYTVIRFWDKEFNQESVREAIDQHCWEPILCV